MGLQKSLFLSANEQQKYNTDTNSHPFIPSFKMIKALAAKFSIDLQQHTLPKMFINNIIIYVKENTHILKYMAIEKRLAFSVIYLREIIYIRFIK